MKSLQTALFVILNVVFSVMLYPIVYGQRVVSHALTKSVLITSHVTAHHGFIGSGVVISKRGHILTVAHLLTDHAKFYTVKLYDGSTDTAHVVGYDVKHDLGLMRLDHPERLLSVAKLSHQPVVRGEDVIIIGYPLGLEFTVTRGIVSGLDRLQIYNQSDAVANPGNSGGPVFDRDGKLIGVLSAGLPFPFFTGQSLFVKLDLIKKFLEDYEVAL